MEGQRKQKKVTQNSLLKQFKIIKQKLQQRGTTILQLKKQLQIERNSMLETLSQFQAHQNRIMSRLRRLQEINLRYIKQYAEIKKIAPPQEMLILTNDKIREVSMRDILLLKVRHYKEYYSQITQNVARPVSQAFHKTVSNVRGLLQQYLVEKQINYHKTMQNLSEQKKKKWKQAKGLESYKISKQQQKMLDSLKLKVNKFKQILGNVNDLNMVEIYNQRKQIQSQIYKLDPSRQEMTLEQSINQQRTFNQIMQEIIMINTEESPADNISQAFLNCQFKALQEKVIDLSQEYDQQFLTQSIGRIQNLSKEMKEGIMRGLSQKQLAQIAQKQRYANTRSQKHQSDKANMNEGDYEQGTYGGLSQNQKTKKYHRSQHNYGQNFQQQQNQNEIEDDFHSQNSENLKFKKKNKYNQNDKESDQISQYDEDGNPLEKQENQKKIKSKKQQRASRPSKLNAAFQTTMTKTFFQEQQKTRDELIGKQITQLQQHQKVIDKLITFIKKEFKDKKMDDIDADDPEQLMGYYFRVNEKKYVDIRQELIEVQTEKKLIEKQKKIIIEQKMQLEGEKEIISNQNRILQEKKTFLQIQNRQLIEEKKIAEGYLQSQKERIMEIEVECQNLRLLLELQKLQIVALSQIYQRLKVNTIQFHNMTQSTENIVKLSLQTLFNLSLNKLRPEEIIQRLQKIIEIIKVNVKLKFDVTSDLTILQFIKKEQQIAKKDFSAQVTSGLVPYIEGSSSNVKKQIMNQYVNFRSQRDVVDNREEKKVCFVDELRQIQFKIIEKEFDQKPSQNLAEQKSEHSGQQNAAQFIPMANNQNQFSKDMLNSLLLLSLQKIKQTECQDKKQRVGFDQNFINAMIENLQRMKDNNSGTDQEDFNEMYHKYKQAVDCLQRSQQLNKEYEMKYQIFLNDLKRKGAYQAPQILEQKLFYMQKVIGQQNELIQNQRKEYENTILKQIEKSEQLAQNVLKGIKLSRKKTTHT